MGRWLRLLGGASLVVATVVAGNAYISVLPERGDMDRAFARSGPMNTQVVARNFSAAVLGVRGGTRLVQSDGSAHETAGVWVIIKVRVAALTEPTYVSSLLLRDDAGREFHPTERVNQPVLNRVLQPGIPVVGEVAIEVPKDAHGFVLRLFDGPNAALDAVVEVQVPVADPKVWLTGEQMILLAPVEVDLG
jgi:hypothetical protein